MKNPISIFLLAILIVLLILQPEPSIAQISLNSGSYTQNFNSLALSGAANTWVNNSTLPGWYASQGASSTAVTSYGAGTGSGNTGGFFSYGSSSSSDRALGSLASGTTGDLAYGVRFTNDTALTQTNFLVSYTGEQWRNGGSSNQNTLSFSYRVSASPLTNSESGSTTGWTNVPALDFAAPMVGTNAGLLDGNTNHVFFSGVPLTGLSVQPGQELFLRWRDVNDLGSDDGIALDDLTVSFTNLNTAPVITGQPQSRTNFTTQTATFTVTATGTPPLSYQWRSNSISLADGGRFSGVTNLLFSITNVQTNDAADYTVIVTNLYGAVTSAVAKLTVVVSFPPNISAQPTSQTVAAGSNATFQVSATGTAPLSYQWHFGNVPLAGPTTNSLTLTNAQATNAGDYTVVVTNSFGAVTSQVATLTVTPAAPRITLQPLSLGVLFGANGTLITAASGTEPLSFQWRFNNTDLPDATNSSLNLTNVQEFNAGSYRAVITNSIGSTNTASVQVGLTAVVSWGDNLNNQAIVPATATNVVSIAGGNNHSVASRTDGSVLTWGLSGLGLSPVPSSATNVVAVAAGDLHSLALRSNGTVVVWGHDGGTGLTNVPTSATNVTAITGGSFHNLALRRNGTVIAWGDDSLGQTDIPPEATNVMAIAAGAYHNLVLRSNGTVIAWGGGDQSTATNVPASLSNVVAIAAGFDFSLALKADGTLASWGDGGFLQNHVPSDATNLVAIATGDGETFCMGLRADGRLFVWGQNVSLGETNVPSSALTNVLGIAGGGFHCMALIGQPLRLDSAAPGFRLTSTGAVLRVTGLSGRGQVVIEASSNLVSWLPILTNAPVTGVLKSTDPSATNRPMRFYRATEVR